MAVNVLSLKTIREMDSDQNSIERHRGDYNHRRRGNNILPPIISAMSSTSTKSTLNSSMSNTPTNGMAVVTTRKSFIEPKKRGYFDFEDHSQPEFAPVSTDREPASSNTTPKSKQLLQFVLKQNEPKPSMAFAKAKEHFERASSFRFFKPDGNTILHPSFLQGPAVNNNQSQATSKSLYSQTKHLVSVVEKPLPLEKRKILDTQTDKCNICVGQRFNSTVLHCGHSFCKCCIKNYLMTAITSHTCPIICPYPDCSKQITIYDVWRIVPVPEFKLYEKILTGLKHRASLANLKMQSPLLNERAEIKAITPKNPIKNIFLKRKSLKFSE